MNLIAVGKCEKPFFSYPRHHHESWEIILQLTGEATTLIGRDTYTLSPGDIAVIPPGTDHSATSDTACTDMYFSVRGSGLNHITVIHDRDRNIQTLMQMLHRAFVEQEDGYAMICEQLCATILQYIRTYAQSTQAPPAVYLMKNLLYENISNCCFSIVAATKKLGYNMDGFRRSFVRETGKTPLEYLTELRINNAKLLLRQERYTGIEHIAAECGFQDPFYFSRRFKQLTGVSPQQYKKMRHLP